jgi:hypothetical protein
MSVSSGGKATEVADSRSSADRASSGRGTTQSAAAERWKLPNRQPTRRGPRYFLASASAARVRLWLMLALTFGTGIVDAVGYLGLDRVFTGNMTGNVVILGMAVVGADDLPVLGPLLALCGFMAGAAVGGRTLKNATPGWTKRASALFAFVGITMVVLAGISLHTR